MEERMSPAVQIRDAIVRHLRGMIGAYQLPIPETQIRGTLDLSGTPKEAYGITVSAEDMGDHAGNTGRVLVDIQPRITVFSHLDEDVDGSLCDSLASDTLEIMQSIAYQLDGWYVAWNGNWQIADTTMDGAFRTVVLTATLPIVRQ
jgi:hypothetical protein